MTTTLFLTMVLAYGVGGLAALMAPRGAVGRGLVALGAVIGAAAGLMLGASVIASGAPFALTIHELLPIAGGLALRLDALGAF
ncbi:MAG: hypothetical protein HY259_13250, partial [Chloroflexi bacterium]|nr:hypothetical protein [Chloroflexota bacterium]